MRHDPPTPMELASAPELVILHGLGDVIDLAQRVILSALPDLEQADFFPDASPLTVEAWLADAIVVHLGAGETALGRYCGHLRSREALRTVSVPAEI